MNMTKYIQIISIFVRNIFQKAWNLLNELNKFIFSKGVFNSVVFVCYI